MAEDEPLFNEPEESEPPRREPELDPPPPVSKSNPQAWMLTFADLVSLMLTFFVLLFSMSSVKMDEWTTLADTLSRQLAPQFDVDGPVTATARFNISSRFEDRATSLDYLMWVLDQGMQSDPVLRDSELFRLANRVVVSLPGDLVFAPGGAELSEEGQLAVEELGLMLARIRNQIGVEGHADPRPYTGTRFTSNWELSMARAAAVGNALRRIGYADPIDVFGVASTRYDDLADLPPVQRFQAARRVDVVIMEHTRQDGEP